MFYNHCRYRLGLFLSLLSLSFVMLIWRDLFFFSKFIDLPAWAYYLPNPVSAPAYLSALSLLPATFIPSGLKAASKAIILSLGLSPILGLIFAALELSTKTSFAEVVLNSIFNYIWAVGFHCALPAIILIALKLLVDTCISLVRKVLRRP